MSFPSGYLSRPGFLYGEDNFGVFGLGLVTKRPRHSEESSGCTINVNL